MFFTKRSWVKFAVAIIMIGLCFIGFGVMFLTSGHEKYVMPAIVMMAIGLVISLIGILVYMWVKKTNRK